MNHPPAQPPHWTLKLGLYGNAMFSLVSAGVLVFGATPVAARMGFQWSGILIVVGLMLIPFAVHVFIAAQRDRLNQSEIVYFCAMDALWILASIALLLTRVIPLNSFGVWAIAIIALFVAYFLLLQLFGLVRSLRALTVRTI